MRWQEFLKRVFTCGKHGSPWEVHEVPDLRELPDDRGHSNNHPGVVRASSWQHRGCPQGCSCAACTLQGTVGDRWCFNACLPAHARTQRRRQIRFFLWKMISQAFAMLLYLVSDVASSVASLSSPATCCTSPQPLSCGSDPTG